MFFQSFYIMKNYGFICKSAAALFGMGQFVLHHSATKCTCICLCHLLHATMFAGHVTSRWSTLVTQPMKIILSLDKSLPQQSCFYLCVLYL